jgi:cobalt-zinc-cadmium efflux system protein
MSRPGRLLAALGANLALTGGLLIAARAAHSSGLAADAGHNLTDALAIGLALIAELATHRPASERRSFGNQRASILAAMVNGIVLVAVTVSIVVFAIERLITPHPVHGTIVAIAAAISIGVNLVVVFLLVEGHQDLGIRSALVHAVGDVLSSAVVCVSGVIVMVARGPLGERVDPVASLVVAGFIVVEAIRVTSASINILLEGVPVDIDLDEVRQCLTSIRGVQTVHHLHVWSLSSSHRALSAHIVVEGDPTVSATNQILIEARQELEDRFRIDHSTIEVESGPCAESD